MSYSPPPLDAGKDRYMTEEELEEHNRRLNEFTVDELFAQTNKSSVVDWKICQNFKRLGPTALEIISMFLDTPVMEDLYTVYQALLIPFPDIGIGIPSPLGSKAADLVLKFLKHRCPKIRWIKAVLLNGFDEKDETVELLQTVVKSQLIRNMYGKIRNVKRNDFYKLTQVLSQPYRCAITLQINMTDLVLDKRDPVPPIYSDKYLWLLVLRMDVDVKSLELLTVLCNRTTALTSLHLSRGKEKSRKGKLRRMKKEKRVEFLKQLELEKQELSQGVGQGVGLALENNMGLTMLSVENFAFSARQRTDLLEAIVVKKGRMQRVELKNTNLDDGDFLFLFLHLEEGVDQKAVYDVSCNMNITNVTRKMLKDKMAVDDFQLCCTLYMTRTGIPLGDSLELNMAYRSHTFERNNENNLICINMEDVPDEVKRTVAELAKKYMK